VKGDAWRSRKRTEDEQRDRDGMMRLAVASCAILGVECMVLGIMSNLLEK